ncbi:MAG: hypothetical protein PF637_03050 [Spirochaetes bacterium]|jgi:outer membrane protein W|nr:hypothetical protein [Spirochaetota bacterium]
MKKITIFILILFSTSMLSALNLQKSAGLTLNATRYSWTYENNDYSSNMSFPYSVIGIEAFFDMTYFRTGISYNGNIGKISSTTESENTETTVKEEYAMTTSDIFLIGKYPFKKGKFDFWPGLGINYSMNLSFEDEDGNEIEDTDLDDLYLLAVIGMDYHLDSKLYITASIDFGYNLDAKTNTGDSNEDDWSGYKSSLKVGAGYKF